MILDLGPTHELIRVTAEYSNAVLVAVLPYIADVSQRLNLPVAHSVSPENVIRCSISPQRRIGALDVEIGIKGDWYFAFKWGFINAIEGPRNYFFLQDPSEIPRCYGTNRISKGEAVRLARKAIANLGIPLEQVFAEQEPHVREADVCINLVPQYSVEWFGPAIQSVRVTINGPLVTLSIDATLTRLGSLSGGSPADLSVSFTATDVAGSGSFTRASAPAEVVALRQFLPVLLR